MNCKRAQNCLLSRLDHAKLPLCFPPGLFVWNPDESPLTLSAALSSRKLVGPLGFHQYLKDMLQRLNAPFLFCSVFVTSAYVFFVNLFWENIILIFCYLLDDRVEIKHIIVILFTPKFFSCFL